LNKTVQFILFTITSRQCKAVLASTQLLFLYCWRFFYSTIWYFIAGYLPDTLSFSFGLASKKWEIL